MRKVILALLFFLLTFSADSVASLSNPAAELAPEENGIKVLYDGKLLSFTHEPIMMNDRVLVPLRELAEQMGASVEWWPETGVLVKKDDREVSATIGRDSVIVNRQRFYMDQPPVIIDDRTFVPIRFINPILDTKTEWDEENQTVTITSASYNESYLLTDKYYKLYTIFAGPASCPSLEEARQYALDNGLLKDVEYMRFVNPRFAIGMATAVFGYDAEGRYKAIWFNTHPDWKIIEVREEAFLDEGVSEDAIKSLLIQEGFAPEEIKDIYLAMYIFRPTELAWHAVVSHDAGTICYLFEFETGELVSGYFENPIYTTP